MDYVLPADPEAPSRTCCQGNHLDAVVSSARPSPRIAATSKGRHRPAGDRQGRIADGVLAVNGLQAEQIIADLLARPEVDLVHLRNVGYGCYNFAVRASG